MFRNVWRTDVWVKLSEREIVQKLVDRRHVVVPDVRFANEAELIHRLGGALIRVARPVYEERVNVSGRSTFVRRPGLSAQTSSHESENDTLDKYIDYEYDNRGTLEKLEKDAIDLYYAIKLRQKNDKNNKA